VKPLQQPFSSERRRPVQDVEKNKHRDNCIVPVLKCPGEKFFQQLYFRISDKLPDRWLKYQNRSPEKYKEMQIQLTGDSD
jgi:hypothetical protein